MKGRTTCPKCKNEFVLDVPDNKEKLNVVCPNCKNKYTIQPKCPSSDSDECSWEEHGEPRKTILSSIKTRTNKPMIAAILLVCVFVIGITTAVFSEIFIESSMNIASEVGITGTVDILVIDQSNNTIQNINLEINDESGITNDKGMYTFKKVELGIQKLEITGQGYKTQLYEILVTPFFNSDTTIHLEEGTGEGKVTNFDTMGCTIILAIFSIFSLLGMITCLKRRHIDVAMVGSFIGIFSFGFFLAGSILSIIAFVLILRSQEEFENGKKGKIF